MSSIVLNDEQQAAYDAIGKHKTLFISGAAGCGKSVVITEKIKNDTCDHFILCATTHKAANVLSEKLNTGVKVPTLHSVLGLKPIHDGSTKEGSEITEFLLVTPPERITHLKGRSLIIDESSMISREVQEYLLKILECGNLVSITFVGDKYQLPCVKGDFFDYDLIETIIDLKNVQRASGSLLNYYKDVRQAVISDTELPLFDEAKVFDDAYAFTAYIKQKEGTKLIITYTNSAAQRYSGLIDSALIYVGQECNALSQCLYKHLDLSLTIGVKTNSIVRILAIFSNYAEMQRDAMREDYEYYLPSQPIGITVNNIYYVKLLNEEDQIIYTSVWEGTQKEKEDMHLNRMNREYRTFQDSIRQYVPKSLWNQYSKEDGYLKNLTPILLRMRLPSYIKEMEKKFWHNFFLIMDALILRSTMVSTAHRAQGMTVDTVGIDLDELEKSDDKKLAYVALTRASKEIVYFRSQEVSYEK